MTLSKKCSTGCLHGGCTIDCLAHSLEVAAYADYHIRKDKEKAFTGKGIGHSYRSVLSTQVGGEMVSTEQEEI